MFAYLMALLGLMVMIAGISLYVLRRRGARRFRHSREDRETQAELNKAFGKNMKWGSPGGAEREFHDRDFNESSEFEGSDSAD